MKPHRTVLAFTAILYAVTLWAQTPSAPANLRVTSAATDLPVGSTIPVPVVSTNGQFVAYWYSPPYVIRTNASPYVQPVANMWITETSTDGVNWTRTHNEAANMPSRAVRALNQPCLDCLRWSEVAAADRVRIRLVAY
jgi:hypothetical protein